MTRRRSGTRFSGQSLVEFALVGPIFFMMLLGTVEMGRLMWINHELSNGTREGARWAAVRGEHNDTLIGDADVKAIVIERTNALNEADLAVTLTWSDADRVPGSTVTVVTAYQYQPLIGGFLGTSSFTLERRSVLTVHY